MNKVILEGDTSKADIVLGLDMNLFDLAEQSGLFTSHNIKDINNLINLPLKWETNKFVPYNYGYFSFVYNEANLETPPKSMDELINSTNARIVIQDPRTSTPGLGLLTWMKALYGEKAGDEWKKLNKKIISVTKGWTDAYYNFFMAGEADMVLSYSTSPAAHIMFEDSKVFESIGSSWEKTDEHGSRLFMFTLIFALLILFSVLIVSSVVPAGFAQALINSSIEYAMTIPLGYIYFTLYKSIKTN